MIWEKNIKNVEIRYYPHPYERVYEMLERNIIDIPEARWLLGLEHDLEKFYSIKKLGEKNV